MKDRKEFLEANDRLKTLDDKTLNDELNKMSFDELIAHRDCMIDQTLDEGQMLSEEEAKEHIGRLIQMTREPSEAESKPIKIHTYKTAKRIAALAAAILLLISILTLAAVASKREFSIFNGTVTFEDGKIYVKFNQNEDDTSLTMTELETDLREHGFEDVKIPGYFYEEAWKAKNIVYTEESISSLVNFDVESTQERYSFSIISHEYSDYSKDMIMLGAESGETIQQGNMSLYLFNHGKGRLELIYFFNNCQYVIRSEHSYEMMKAISKTIK